MESLTCDGKRVSAGRPYGSGLGKFVGLPQVVKVIQGVSEKGMFPVCHVDPDLVSAAGLKLQTDSRITGCEVCLLCAGCRYCFPGIQEIGSAGRGKISKCLKVSDRPVTPVKIHTAFNERVFLAGNRQVDGAFGRGMSVDDCQIGPVDFPFYKLLLQNGGTDEIFCHDQQTCSVSVQAVDAAEDKGNILLLKIPDDAISQSIGRMADGRVDCFIGRLIDDKQIRILINDPEGNRGRDDCL